MAKEPYTKPAITYTEQLVKLKRRGLVIDDEPAFLELLEKKSYYRLSGYWYPLLDDKTNHIFKPGANFHAAYKLYEFDRDLRQLVIKELLLVLNQLFKPRLFLHVLFEAKDADQL